MTDKLKFIESIKHRYAQHNISVIKKREFIRNESFEPNSKIYVSSANGPFLFGIDGQRYIDLVLGGGAILLGHGAEIVVDAARKALDLGTIFVQPHLVGEQLAETILECLPNHLGGVVFCSSGTEATLRAIRLARAFTGKDKIAVFSGGWHGSHDYVLIGEEYSKSSGGTPASALASAGIPESIKDMCLLLPYNNDMALDMIEKHRNQLAMVLIEPIQGSNPRDDVAHFLTELRSVTTKNSVLLGFDEIITGFRLGIGGAQEHFGIEADLVMLGKAVGGGFPLAAVAGRSDIMDKVKDGVFMGGTFSANPFACSISLALVSYLQKNGEGIYSKLEANGQLLKGNINNFCQANSVPVRMWGTKSFLRLIFTDQLIQSRKDRDAMESPQSIQKLFFSELANRGIMVSSNRIIFLSAAHDMVLVEDIARSINNLLLEFFINGLFDENDDINKVGVNDKTL